MMRIVRIAAAAVLVAAAMLVASAPGAQASGPTINGAGSTWVQIALDQWRADAARQGLASTTRASARRPGASST